MHRSRGAAFALADYWMLIFIGVVGVFATILGGFCMCAILFPRVLMGYAPEELTIRIVVFCLGIALVLGGFKTVSYSLRSCILKMDRRNHPDDEFVFMSPMHPWPMGTHRSPAKHQAAALGQQLFDSVKCFLETKQDLESENDHGPFRIAGENMRVRLYGSSSRGLFWESSGVPHRMWFEVRGWVHFNKDDQEIYRQVLWTDLPNPQPDRSDEFKGNMSEFLLVGKRILHDLSKHDKKLIGGLNRIPDFFLRYIMRPWQVIGMLLRGRGRDE